MLTLSVCTIQLTILILCFFIFQLLILTPSMFIIWLLILMLFFFIFQLSTLILVYMHSIINTNATLCVLTCIMCVNIKCFVIKRFFVDMDNPTITSVTIKKPTVFELVKVTRIHLQMLSHKSLKQRLIHISFLNVSYFFSW